MTPEEYLAQHELTQKLGKAFRELLPAGSGCDDGIIDSVVGMLQHLKQEDGKQHPRPNKFFSSGTQATQKELSAVSTAAKKLHAALEVLHQDAHVALFEAGLGNDLHELRRLVRIAAQPVAATGSRSPVKGRPSNLHADAVTKIVADGFCKLTGRQPSIIVDPIGYGHPAGGPFIDLLGKVFCILNVTASTEACARKYCDHKEKND